MTPFLFWTKSLQVRNSRAYNKALYHQPVPTRGHRRTRFLSVNQMEARVPSVPLPVPPSLGTTCHRHELTVSLLSLHPQIPKSCIFKTLLFSFLELTLNAPGISPLFTILAVLRYLFFIRATSISFSDISCLLII